MNHPIWGNRAVALTIALLLAASLLTSCGANDGRAAQRAQNLKETLNSPLGLAGKVPQEEDRLTGQFGDGEMMPSSTVDETATSNLKLTPDGEAAMAHDYAIQAQSAGSSAPATPKAKPASNQELQRKYPSVLVMKGNPAKRELALTFDDGPDRRFTPQVLDILKKHGVKATFFLIGSRVKAHSDMAKRIAEEGHVIGNHTFWHPKLYSESLERLHWEASETDNVIEAAVGYKPKLFRAPYGGLTDPVLKSLGEMGYNVIGWSVDSLDWKQIPSDQVIANVMKDVAPGGILLMHSGGHWTEDLSGMITALDKLIPMLRSQGYTFVTVPQMIETTASR